MTSLLAVGIVLVILLFVCELSSILTTGFIVSEERLDAFFTPERLHEYRASGATKNLIYGLGINPYIAKSISTTYSRWYIRDIRNDKSWRIPRWSKWSKVVDAMYKELYQPPKSIL